MVEKFDIKIENIVASSSLGIKLPLRELAKHLEGTEYEPEQFPGLVYRLTDPKAATLIFSSGKIVCTGARSVKDVKKVIKKIVSVIRAANMGNPKNYNTQVENIVASAKLESRVSLDKIAFQLEDAEYEPEQFPGLVLRMKNPKVTFLVFSSGKIICTGARKIEDVEYAVAKISKRLKDLRHRKD